MAYYENYLIEIEKGMAELETGASQLFETGYSQSSELSLPEQPFNTLYFARAFSRQPNRPRNDVHLFS